VILPAAALLIGSGIVTYGVVQRARVLRTCACELRSHTTSRVCLWLDECIS
jgi:hypothetical protein